MKLNITYLGITLTLLLTLVSCEDFLEIEPKNAISDELSITDENSLLTVLRGAYRQLGAPGYYGETYVTLAYFAGGDVVNNTTGGAANLVEANYRADDGLFQSAWSAIYRTINLTNHVIAKAPTIEDIGFTEAERNQVLGEAHFIRALAYFDLARAWGGVPLKLTPTLSISESIGIPRSTLDETYAQVLSDLEKAESLLPETTNRIRATRHSARALRARYHLYRQEWSQAESYATLLINNPSFNLRKPFSSWFANGVTETEESIFEVAFSALNPNSIKNQMQHPLNGGTYRYAPNDNLVSLITKPSIGGERVALIDSVVQGNTKLYQGDLYYRSPATDPSYVLRIAEQYLIRAEARAKQNTPDKLLEAISDINEVRDRAGLAATEASTRSEILLAIEEERRFEFLWEAHRWFDLSRTGRLKAVIEGLDPQKRVDPHEYVFPIPNLEVQLDGLEQNPDY